MKTTARLLLVTLGALTVSVTQTAIAIDKEVLNFWEIVQCPDEQIEMEGSVRFQYQELGDSDSWVFQAFWTGDAWGLTSGADYRIQGKWMEVVKGPLIDDTPFLFIWNDHFELIGKGTAPNYRFYNKVRVHMDANGIPRIEFADSDSPCETIDFAIWP